MKRILAFVFIGVMLLNSGIFVKAEDTNKIHVIYSDLEVSKEEEFIVTINFDKVLMYSSIQLVVDLGEYFEVVGKVPCNQLVNSYYKDDEIYVNQIENNLIRFVAFKKSNDFTTSFNNIVQITLKSKINCSDVSKYLNNMKVGLFDNEYNIIPVMLVISEGIKVNWFNDVYTVELNDPMPYFIDDIEITNRSSDQYVIKVLTDDIDLSKVGPQIVTAYVYDYTNSSVLYLSRSINVVDSIKPVISGNSAISINDVDLSLDSINMFQVIDNYDLAPIVNVTYYDVNGTVISNSGSFLEYLKKETIGTIHVVAVDSSKNVSDEFIQVIKIIDTLAPTVEVPQIINIMDYELDTFDIYDFIKIADVYDKTPNIILSIVGKQEMDVKKALSENYTIELTLYGIDNLNNKSEEQNIQINLIDTIPPIIEKLGDITVSDKEYKDLNSLIQSQIKISDNFTLSLNINYEYYDKDTKITKEQFEELLFSGKKLKVVVSASDSKDNVSNQVTLEIEIVDTTKPTLEILNIEEGKKYLNIPNVEYKVNDNFKTAIDVLVLLDGEIYSETPINLIGKHTLVIKATDAAGNETSQQVNFEIIKNNLIGCGLDKDCYADNYTTIIYIASVLLGISIVVVAVNIIVKKSKNKLN